ncbi:hypothetical protein [Clostridium transplantifaecale]|uniref:hypothetical protein n=1 Tax=Clostridium transplantifaecale TaxID=2479838 RepID=UPI000F635934|nr:hypothetical protein [Clostridium transplantifaecale]
MKTENEISEIIAELLAEKKQLFEKFESITEQMMTDSFDEIDMIVECVDRREELRKQIDELDLKISSTAMECENGEEIIKASKNLCDFSEVSPALQKVFTAGQEVFGVISRIQSADPQAVRNMKAMMEELQQKIRQNKKNSKFTGYINTMGLQASKGALYDKKR